MNKENPANNDSKQDYDENGRDRREEKKELSESKRGDSLMKNKCKFF
jgi:hypothetical protein